jgi:REP element-mobilizing transposase RayT
MQKVETLLPDCYYHIYNRGNNREALFFEKENYLYFLDLYSEYIDPTADTFAYCLLINHFHFSVRMKNLFEICSGSCNQNSEVSETSEDSKIYSQAFSNMFNAYVKAINKRYSRTGSLFQTRFGRKRIMSNEHLVHIIHYIHFNPQKHGFIKDYRQYPHSSYRTFLSDQNTRLKKEEIIEWFGGLEGFQRFHDEYRNEINDCIRNYIIDDK